MYKNIPDSINGFVIKQFIHDTPRDMDIRVREIGYELYGVDYSSKRIAAYIGDKDAATKNSGLCDMGKITNIIKDKQYDTIFNITDCNGDLRFGTRDDMYNFIDYILGVLKKDGYEVEIY